MALVAERGQALKKFEDFADAFCKERERRRGAGFVVDRLALPAPSSCAAAGGEQGGYGGAGPRPRMLLLTARPWAEMLHGAPQMEQRELVPGGSCEEAGPQHVFSVAAGEPRLEAGSVQMGLEPAASDEEAAGALILSRGVPVATEEAPAAARPAAAAADGIDIGAAAQHAAAIIREEAPVGARLAAPSGLSALGAEAEDGAWPAISSTELAAGASVTVPLPPAEGGCAAVVPWWVESRLVIWAVNTAIITTGAMMMAPVIPGLVVCAGVRKLMSLS